MSDERTQALDKLVEAVEAGRLVTIPTPHHSARVHSPDRPARIMGYVEGYAVMRHKGAAPFLMTTKDVIKALRAYRATLTETTHD